VAALVDHNTSGSSFHFPLQDGDHHRTFTRLVGLDNWQPNPRLSPVTCTLPSGYSPSGIDISIDISFPQSETQFQHNTFIATGVADTSCCFCLFLD
jgi:hypothetical protein